MTLPCFFLSYVDEVEDLSKTAIFFPKRLQRTYFHTTVKESVSTELGHLFFCLKVPLQYPIGIQFWQDKWGFEWRTKRHGVEDIIVVWSYTHWTNRFRISISWHNLMRKLNNRQWIQNILFNMITSSHLKRGFHSQLWSYLAFSHIPQQSQRCASPKLPNDLQKNLKHTCLHNQAKQPWWGSKHLHILLFFGCICAKKKNLSDN